MGPRRYELKLQVPALIARSVGPRHPSAIARLKHRSPLTRIDCRSAQAWVPAMEEDQSEDGEDGHAHLQPGAHLRLAWCSLAVALAQLVRGGLTPKRATAGRSLQCRYARHALSH